MCIVLPIAHHVRRSRASTATPSWPREAEDRSLRRRLPSDASAAHVANNVHPRSNSMLKDTGNDQGNCRHLYTKA